MNNKYYLYFIRSLIYRSKRKKGKNPVKVGITSNLDRRLAQLQTGSPFKLEIVQAFTLKDFYHAKALESRLHKKLAVFGKGYFGEWFDGEILNQDYIIKMIMQEIERDDNSMISSYDLEMINKFNAMN